jgi:DCN1-like protein 1/2
MACIDPKEKVIEVNGIIQLCERLGVEPTDPVMLVLASKCGCKTNCVFTKSEFLSGMQLIK